MYRVDSYVKNGEIRLVYLMNDAVESFLVFGNARMTVYTNRITRARSWQI